MINLFRGMAERRILRQQAVKSMEQLLSGLITTLTLGSSMLSKGSADKRRQVEQFKRWIYVASNKNANGVAKAKLRLWATRGPGEQRSRAKARLATPAETARLKAQSQAGRTASAEEIEEIVEHPFLDLMQNVNPWQNQHDLMYLLSVFMDLTGVGYWHIIKGPTGLPEYIWPLPSQYTKPVPDKRKFIAEYLYGVNPIDPVHIPPEEVVRFPRPSPTDMFEGASRVAAAWLAIGGNDQDLEYATRLLLNNAVPPSMIQATGGAMLPKQRKDFELSFNQAVRNIARQGGSFAVDKDLAVKSLAERPRDMAMLATGKVTKSEILSIFGQTEALYDSNANRANIEGAIFLWQNDELTPTLNLIEQKLNERLIPLYNEPRLFVAFDPLVQRDKAEVRQDQQLLLQNGYPLNLILTETDRNPVEGGDVGYIPGTQVPLGSSPTPPQDITPMLNIRDASSDLRTLPGKAHRKGPASGVLIKASGDIELTGAVNRPMTKREREIAEAMTDIFIAQTTIALRESAKAAAADFDWVASEEWAQEIVDLVSGAIREEVIIGSKEGARTAGVQLIDFIDRPAVQDAITQHNFQFAEAIGLDSRDQLKAALSEGIANGDSIPQLQKRIGGIYEGWQDWRGERIARTESARASMFGEERMWQESGVVATKIWDANGDACPFCLAMDGKTIELGTAYIPMGTTQVVEFEGREIKMKHNYTAIEGPPLHPNCRCGRKPGFIEM